MDEQIDKIWIELPKPGETPNVRSREDMERICKLVNRMLHRLGTNEGPAPERLFVFDDKGYLMYAINDGPGYFVLNDFGHWFSLTYMGRE